MALSDSSNAERTPSTNDIVQTFMVFMGIVTTSVKLFILNSVKKEKAWLYTFEDYAVWQNVGERNKKRTFDVKMIIARNFYSELQLWCTFKKG